MIALEDKLIVLQNHFKREFIAKQEQEIAPRSGQFLVILRQCFQKIHIRFERSCLSKKLRRAAENFSIFASFLKNPSQS